MLNSATELEQQISTPSGDVKQNQGKHITRSMSKAQA